MINRISHVSIFVLDQNTAYEFYVNKLGFKVHTDAPMGPDARWLTVCPPDQPDLELSLIHVSPGMMFNEETAGMMRELVRRGTFGYAVFECVDIYATYEELKVRGVVFKKEPTKEFYGTEALFSDDSGNWFSLGQKE